MKKTLFLLLGLTLLLSASAQMSDARLPALDKSPMDMVYYPANYPVLKIQDKATEPLVVRLVYSRPQKSGRTIFGDLVEYNKVWRLGANEATEIEFFKDVRIGGRRVPKGRYTLYALVNPDKWTMILNKETDVWGAFKYNPSKDVLRVDVPVRKLTESVEAFTAYFDKNGTGADLTIMWDDVKVTLPIATK